MTHKTGEYKMTEQDKPMKIVFAPGCFDSFDGTQEELDDMIAEIQRMADSGELFENAHPIEESEDLTEEEIADLQRRLDELDKPRRLN